MTQTSLPIAVIGLDAHGREVARCLAEAGIGNIVGIDPFLHGRDLGELTGARALAGREVAVDLDAAGPLRLAVAAAPLAARPAAPRTLYYSPGSCALAPHIVANHAGIPLEFVKVDLASHRTGRGQDYLAINPHGYVPALVLGDGQVLTEASLLVQYLADLRPASGLIPAAGTHERYQAQQALAFIATELHKGMDAFYLPGLGDEARAAQLARLRRRIAHVDGQLAGRDWLLGERFGVADAYLWVVLRSTPGVGIDLARFANVSRYLDAIAALHAVRQSLREQERG